MPLKCLAALEGERAALPMLRVMIVDNAPGDEPPDKLGEARNQPKYCKCVDFVTLPIS